MKNRYLPLALLGILFVAIGSNVSADTLCLRSVIKNGKIVHRKRIVLGTEQCPQGHIPLISGANLATTSASGGITIQGETGPQGPQGPSGSSDLTLAFGESQFNSNNKTLFVPCPQGMHVLSASGGVRDGLGLPISDSVALSYMGPNVGGTSVAIRAYETVSPYSNTWQIYGVALCRP